MAESPKLFDYQNPNNIEAEVPGAQKIRGPRHGLNTPNDAESTSNDGENTPNDGKNTRNDEENTSNNAEKVSNENLDLVPTDDFSYEPVIVVTKKEAHFTKGDLKLQKVTVTEDISVSTGVSRTRIPISKFKQTVEKVKADRRGSKDHESHIPVRRTSIPKPKKDIKNDLTLKTNITNAADDEFDKIYNEIVVDTPTEVNIDSILSPKIDDLIESTFEDIIHDYDDIDDEVEVRKKINSKEGINFEVTKEPNNGESIEVVRRSKIPFRKNQQDESSQDRSSKILAARDKLRLRYSLTKGEDLEKELDKELDNSKVKYDAENNEPKERIEKEYKHEIISSPNSEVNIKREVTKTFSNKSDAENKESTQIVESVTVKEVTNEGSKDDKQFLIEENIIKHSIKIGIPVFDAQTQEVLENEKNETRTVEVKRVLSCNKNEDFNTTNTTFENRFSRELDVSFTENNIKDEKPKVDKLVLRKDISVENKDNPVKTKEEFTINDKDVKKEEEIIQLRGKVERIISKIDSKEVIEIDGCNRESINELRKKKSVMSKIALFERNEVKTPHNEIKYKPKEHTHVHTPLIVDEVFKFQQETNLNDDEHKEENSLTGPTIEEKVTVGKDFVYYATENKVQIETTGDDDNTYKVEEVVQSELSSNDIVHKGGIATITDINVSNKEFKNDEPNNDKFVGVTNDFKHENNNYDSLIIANEDLPINDQTYNEYEPTTPRYKTVSELLKSFESKPPKRTKRHFSREFSLKEKNEKLSEFQSNDEIHENYEIIENNIQIPEYKRYESQPIEVENSQKFNTFESINEYKSLDDVFTTDFEAKKLKLRPEDDFKRTKSLAELDLGNLGLSNVKGRVNNVIRMISVDKFENKKEKINVKEMPRKRSVSEKIALFEGKVSTSRGESPVLRVFKPEKYFEPPRMERKIETLTKINRFETKDIIDLDIKRPSSPHKEEKENNDEEQIKKRIEELRSAKVKYGRIENMPVLELSNGIEMPVLAVGTAMLDPRLIYHIITAAIDMGYRAIDAAYIYGNEVQVGEAIRAKIDDGTVKREDLFIISKLWSTFHRTDLVESACRDSLHKLGLDYIDLYLIHNPMSFKEGGGPLPKIATVLQYSEYDYLDAWYGMETVVAKGLARAIGVSNFNSVQLQRVLDKGRIKPVVNQVECHPYLSQQRLDHFCADRNITLSCYGVLGSKGTPIEHKSGSLAAIDDPLVQVMASGLSMTPAQLLIRYQLENSRSVVVKSSSAAHLWDNLQALNIRLTAVEGDALNALNRNRRTFTFRGMGDTHKNYPFNIPF